MKVNNKKKFFSKNFKFKVNLNNKLKDNNILISKFKDLFFYF